MKHRSPLVTLAAVALAFAIMFIVNIVSGPPGSGSTGASPSAAPATTSRSLQPTVTAAATPTASASETAEDTFPEEVVYAGRAEDSQGAIAVAVLGSQAAAYFCDGRNVEAWFRGTAEGGNITLKSKSGATLNAELDGTEIKGTVQVENDTVEFEIDEAKQPAGLYRARGSKTTIGWIVLPDRSQVGVQTTGSDSSAAPQLDPENPRVTVDGESLDAAPVNGDEDL
ncbi:MAG TPA: hypothetical protein VJ820_04970 [Propionibacteriaceae bacterium]|nr:hypothetical protein [Propionibacteriaceae bacterium]